MRRLNTEDCSFDRAETDTVVSSASPRGVSSHHVHCDGRSHDATSFGKKTINFHGSLALTTNNILGPGMLVLPLLFQTSGWLFPTLIFIGVAAAGYYASIMLAESMAALPGNELFQDRVEMSTLTKFYAGKHMFVLMMIALVIALQAVNVVSIATSAQTFDQMLFGTAGKVCGLALQPVAHTSLGPIISDQIGPLFCINDTVADSNSPFGSHYVLSAGFVLLMLITVPLGLVNLDDNIKVQIVTFYMNVGICILWVGIAVYFLVIPDPRKVWTDHHHLLRNTTSLPLVPDSEGLTTIAAAFGTVIFNYAYVCSIPSWINEKSPRTSVKKPLFWSTVIGTACFLPLGIFPAMIFEFRHADVLHVLGDLSDGCSPVFKWIVRVSIYLFPFAAMLPSIPVFSIIVRYNLVENQLCGKVMGNIIATALPWVLGIPAYCGNTITQVVNFSSLLAGGVVNFILPIVLFVLARRKKKETRAARGDTSFVREHLDPEDRVCSTVTDTSAALLGTTMERNQVNEFCAAVARDSFQGAPEVPAQSSRKVMFSEPVTPARSIGRRGSAPSFCSFIEGEVDTAGSSFTQTAARRKSHCPVSISGTELLNADTILHSQVDGICYAAFFNGTTLPGGPCRKCELLNSGHPGGSHVSYSQESDSENAALLPARKFCKRCTALKIAQTLLHDSGCEFPTERRTKAASAATRIGFTAFGQTTSSRFIMTIVVVLLVFLVVGTVSGIVSSIVQLAPVPKHYQSVHHHNHTNFSRPFEMDFYLDYDSSLAS